MRNLANKINKFREVSNGTSEYYPSISLNRDQLPEIYEAEVGDTVYLYIKAKVKSKTESDYEGDENTSCSLELIEAEVDDIEAKDDKEDKKKETVRDKVDKMRPDVVPDKEFSEDIARYKGLNSKAHRFNQNLTR